MNTPWWSFDSITEVIIGEGVTGIGANAFVADPYLYSVTLPSTIQRIEERAFDCSSLSKINLPEGMTYLGDYAFPWCYNLNELNLPSTLTEMYPTSLKGNNLRTLTVAAGNPKFDSRDNCNAIILTEANEVFTGTPATVIPTSVTSIGANAFDNNNNLKTFVIPDHVTNIGMSAFSACYTLRILTIGKGVKTIDKDAFRSCERTDTVFCYADPATLTWLGFDNAKNFKPNKGTFFVVKKSDLSVWQEKFANLNATIIAEEGEEQPEPATIAFVLNNKSSKAMTLKQNIAEPFTSPTLRVSPEGRKLIWRTNISVKPANEQDSILVQVNTDPFEVKLLNTNGTGQTDVDVVVYDEYITAMATLKVSFYADTYKEPEVVEVEPVKGETTITFNSNGNEGTAITEETDLTNTEVDGVLMPLNEDAGDGYDATDQSIVLNSEMSVEEVETILEQLEPGSGAFAAMFSGMTFKLPAGTGSFYVDFLTMGDRVLTVKIGDNAALTFSKSEKGKVKIDYDCQSETYVYIYGSSSAAAPAPARSLVFRKQAPRKAEANSNAVKIYGFEIKPQTVITGIEQNTTTARPADANWYSIDGRRLSTVPVQKGIYVNNGRKIVVK